MQEAVLLIEVLQECCCYTLISLLYVTYVLCRFVYVLPCCVCMFGSKQSHVIVHVCLQNDEASPHASLTCPHQEQLVIYA